MPQSQIVATTALHGAAHGLWEKLPAAPREAELSRLDAS